MPNPVADPIVEVRALSKTFVAGGLPVPALRAINLSIGRGEIVAVMGPSGCGKTTLLHCLAGLEDFESGDVLIEGRSLRALTDAARADQRARRFGFVFQSFNLLPVLTARENVELPLLLARRPVAEARQRAAQALAAVGLTDWARHRPSELSGGQQQRVAIARALATEPALIVADEPTGNLDSAAAAVVLDLFTQLNQERGQTIVLVTHDRAVAARAGRVIRMRDGTIEAIDDGAARPVAAT